jgi:hypothetical protein
VAGTLPIIDVGALRGGDLEQKLSVARQIGAACRDVGFFIIINHYVRKGSHMLYTLPLFALTDSVPVHCVGPPIMTASPCVQERFVLTVSTGVSGSN